MSLCLNDLMKITACHPDYAGAIGDFFVETGTGAGETVFYMSSHFKKLYTIEILDALYAENIRKARELNITNIDFYRGDTLDILPSVAKKIDGPAVFWLDGHHCLDGYRMSLGKGRIDPPMKEEIEIIFDNHNEQSIIIVDDAMIFGKFCNWMDWNSTPENSDDWTHINTDYLVRNIKPERISGKYINGNKFIVLMKKI